MGLEEAGDTLSNLSQGVGEAVSFSARVESKSLSEDFSKLRHKLGLEFVGDTVVGSCVISPRLIDFKQ